MLTEFFDFVDFLRCAIRAYLLARKPRHDSTRPGVAYVLLPELVACLGAPSTSVSAVRLGESRSSRSTIS